MASEVLRNYIRDMIVESSPFSSNYSRREDIRAYIQTEITGLIDSGDIATQEDLEDFFTEFKNTVDSTIDSLRLVPLSGFSESRK